MQVIQAYTGCWVHVVDRYFNDGRLIVVRHHAADDAGTHQVEAQLLQACPGAIVVLRNDRPGFKALLGHHDPAHIGAPKAE